MKKELVENVIIALAFEESDMPTHRTYNYR